MEKKIKCVVWDLDNTIWDGVLLEDKEVTLKENIFEAIKELDRRGILQSISSKNNEKDAMAKLEEQGISEYFIYPQINWQPKSESISEIAKLINIGLDAVALLDDQQFEREEVNFNYPEVLCIDPADGIENILARPELNPKYITSDSKNRRLLYQTDIVRNHIETEFKGPKEEFLMSLGLKMTVSKAVEEDLQRAEELTVRTHQMNSTGYTFSYEELKEFIESEEYEVLMVQLDDKYGTYGKIGLILIRKYENSWDLYLLLMSCRVMSRGVGAAMLNYIINLARKNNTKLYAKFVSSDKNRIMYITYKFAGFAEIKNENGLITMEADMKNERIIPDYIKILEA